MPAYNAAETLRMTYAALPLDVVDLVILVDDGSSDQTKEIAKELKLELFVHNKNYGYGANQKTCYREALKAGADVVVMVHPDYQYDPTLLPAVIKPIEDGLADVVLGSRLLGGKPMAGGMPWWKYLGNKFLTGVENRVFGLKLAEYHTGYRAFHHSVLEQVNLGLNSDNFLFDQEIIAQIVELKFRIGEVAVPTRYFREASSASFGQSVVYGLSILRLLFLYCLHKAGIMKQKQFDSLERRYSRQRPAEGHTK
jgi:glycosyltransferase involved in cell wall biosynthesis